jgi:glutamate--cysteine ligase
MKGEDDIPIASYKEEHLRGKELYREYLAQKYGKRRMLFSGIHFNFSFSDALLEIGYEQSELDSFQEYKDKLYLELAKKITKYSWLIVYLTAASPLMDGSFFEDGELGKTVFKNFASPRCSAIGYWNEFEPVLAYDSLQSYVRSIEEYIEQGQLKSASELYYPVRLKPKGENSLENLKQSGINHIELRMLDLNPLEPIGIAKADLEFLHRLILYVLSLEDGEFEVYEQVMAVQNEKRAAQYDEESIWIETGWNTGDSVKLAALEILADMEAFFERIDSPESVEVVQNQRQKITNPQKRYATQVIEKFQIDYVKQGVELAARYADEIDR